MRKRLFGFLPMAVVLALVLAAFNIAPAFAATSTAHTTKGTMRPLVTCSGYGCDHQDPAATGCSAGAVTIGTQYNTDGYVELRYSPTCGTNWARVTSTVGVANIYGIIVRQSDGASDAFQVHTATQIYTNMLYAPGPAKACGQVNARYGSYGCYSQY